MGFGRSTADTEALLQQVPLFAELGSKDRKRLAEVCIDKDFCENSLIVEEGKPGLGLFIITVGEVEVFHQRDGDRHVVATLGPGGILGEMSLVDNQPRVASAIATQTTQALMITRESFHELVRKHAGIAWCIVPVLTARFRKAETMLAQLMKQTPEQIAADEGANAAMVDQPQEPPPQSEKPSINTERLLDGLRAEYALMMAGAETLGRGAGVLETFLRAFAKGSDLDVQTEMKPFIKTLPDALRGAAAEAMQKGEKLPEQFMSRFRREWKRE